MYSWAACAGETMPMLNEARDAPAAVALAGVLAAGRLHWNDGKDPLDHEVWRPPVSTLQRERCDARVHGAPCDITRGGDRNMRSVRVNSTGRPNQSNA